MALFTVLEARAFKQKGETPLSNTAKYPDADITAAEARIKRRFEDYCGVAFETTARIITFSGDGRGWEQLPNRLVQSVTSVKFKDNGTFVVQDLASLDVAGEGGYLHWDGGWPRGARNVEAAYTHGFSAVPDPIKRAALQAAVYELVSYDGSQRTITSTDELGTHTFSVADDPRGRPYGLPEVDSVLNSFFNEVVLA